MVQSSINIADFINEIRNEIQLNHQELISTFETYAAEAVFGRDIIDKDLNLLAPSSSIIEVGAGSLILSCQLLREGYHVTALEPIGEGFSHFTKLQDIVLKVASEVKHQLVIIGTPAEHLNVKITYDYAFSINVMEHVIDEKQVIANVLNALKVGAKYRFICPNYIFPYEPHFNIPTLFSKKLTEKIFKKRILSHHVLTDPWGTWQSLNWISVPKIKSIVSQLNNSSVMFSRDLLLKMLERAVVDKQFSKRRSRWMNSIFKSIVSSNLHQLTALIPATVQPVIDCVVIKE
jgi:16S rRNA A1518/A1519 N6-dimethyltransferase RsmA/KsgA/DIM1 with predicted DNA glycosylase/AP lyase activity